MEIVFESLENIVGKGGNAGKQFSKVVFYGKALNNNGSFLELTLYSWL